MASPDSLTLTAPLLASATYWADPWLVTMATERGHRRKEAIDDSEDSLLVTRCGKGIFIALADGIGSKKVPFARIGAARATMTAASFAQHAIRVEGATELMLMSCMAAAHTELVTLAQRKNLNPDLFASTLLLAYLEGHRVVAAHIGDGSLFTWDERRLVPFCSAELRSSGAPYTITQPDWRSYATTALSERAFIKAVVVCTDGAEHFFMDRPSPDAMPKPSTRTLAFLANEHRTNGLLSLATSPYRMFLDPEHLKKTDDCSFAVALKV